MSYYENRIKALEAKVAEMARMQRHKVIPVEAKLVERIAEYQAENISLKAENERLRLQVGTDAIDREHGMCCDSSAENARLKAEVERLTDDNRQLKKAFEIAEGIIKRMGNAAENAAKEGKQS